MTVRKTGDSWHPVLPVRIFSVTNSSSSWARADRVTLSPSIARFGSHTELSRQRSMRRSTLQPGSSQACTRRQIPGWPCSLRRVTSFPAQTATGRS